MLNPDSPLPLYAQIAAQLEEDILQGRLLPGQKLRSEHQLSEDYQVGRPTVRQATETLVKRNLVERRRGSGTYVSEPQPELGLLSLDGTLASSSGLRADVRLLAAPSCRSSEELAGPAFFLSRLVQLGDQPVCVEEMEFARAHFARLDELWDQKSSLSQLVRGHFGYVLKSAHQAFRVVRADAERAHYLGLSLHHPILKVVRRLDFHDYGVLAVVQLYCSTDHLSFSQEIRP